MDLTNTQVDSLLGLIVSTKDDSLDCDGCFTDVAEFAELNLAGKPLPEALKAIETHLESCPCCADEYNALLDGLKGLE